MRLAALALLLLAACSSTPQLTTSSGFSFASFDSVVIAKPATATDATLFGLDVDMANALGRYGLKVIGDRELEGLKDDARARTLVVRLALKGSGEKHVVTISFDSAATGRTEATITAEAEGNLFDADSRREAFEELRHAVLSRVARDKGLEYEED